MAIFSGSKPKFEQRQRFTPQQQSVLNTLLQQGFGGIAGLLQPLDFAPIAAEARQQFQEQTIPSIAERFTALGGQRSSAFPQILGAAGAGLERGLAAQQAQFGLRSRGLQQQLLTQLLGLGLTPQFEQAYIPGSPGLLQYGAQGLGALLPLLLSGNIGGGLGSLFGLGG